VASELVDRLKQIAAEHERAFAEEKKKQDELDELLLAH